MSIHIIRRISHFIHVQHVSMKLVAKVFEVKLRCKKLITQLVTAWVLAWMLIIFRTLSRAVVFNLE
jgi:hypothetical protein